MEMHYDKYKRLFGIEGSLIEFKPEELKRRWKVLVTKYHPDHKPYGNADHFRFVQEAYAYLKTKCKGISIKEEEKFIDELYGIRELSGESDGKKWYLWDIGEANFKKRAEYFRKHGKSNNGSIYVRKPGYDG
jgi:DnaJ-class molecular chaperone